MGAGQTTVAAFGTVSPAPGLTWNTPSATYYQAYHAGMGNETLTNQNILLPLPALETVHLGVGVTITNSRGVIRLAPDGSDVTFTIMQNDGGNHQAKTVKISNGQAVADFTVIKACTQGWQGFYQSAASPLRWINPATRTSDDAHIDAYEP